MDRKEQHNDAATTGETPLQRHHQGSSSSSSSPHLVDYAVAADAHDDIGGRVARDGYGVLWGLGADNLGREAVITAIMIAMIIKTITSNVSPHSANALSSGSTTLATMSGDLRVPDCHQNQQQQQHRHQNQQQHHHRHQQHQQQP
jgi:hypothetical protein